jgi:four helix bundle protein
MARGSVFEVQTQVFIAGELGYGNPADRLEVDNLSNEVSKMLYALIDKL